MRLALLACTAVGVFYMASGVRAQWAHVKGYVVDARTGAGLAGAHVLLQGRDTRQGTTTDTRGTFAFVHVVPGTYRIKVSFVGYAPYEDTLELSFGQVVEQRIALTPVVVETPVVHVSGSSRKTPVPPGLLYIHPEELLRVPTPDLNADLAAYLSMQPGFVTSGGEKRAVLRSRGNSRSEHVSGQRDGGVSALPYRRAVFGDSGRGP